MKDLLEPFLYPHNLLFYGLLLACICYKKKGLWFLLLFYYLVGNTFLANQVRHWYSQNTQKLSEQPMSILAMPQEGAISTDMPALYVVLGCGGSAAQLPACASARLNVLVSELSKHPNAPAAVLITTRYCQPYLDYLRQRSEQTVIDCFDAGDNTYQEFASLAQRLDKTRYYRFITSDFHSWRVSKLLAQHHFTATVGAVSTQTFRPVNCTLNCLFTINLTNLDFYSKLTAEFMSYAVYRFGGARLTGVVSDKNTP
ncbi:hypothetical protein [Alishewanella tabrizica]|uniref:DUF218 domain-containing protein n=1 Tax=Alishewanella tabrizica TaxID=671278 RepID=A0ABQ2WNF6_9ALTE|nr:hypothetical protein [Alishewanella tabrizica]GGW59448.1 hypothetical protein GCM10008111_14420 [Alishewanella tabrizica]